MGVKLGLSICLSLSLSLKEGYRLTMFENRVLRRISGSKREEVRVEWRKLKN
jgi:hypothetical protein